MSVIWKSLDNDRKYRNERTWNRCEKILRWLDEITKPFQL